MKKTIIFIILIFFVHFFLLRGLFSSLDHYTPLNTSGNPFASALELIISFIACCIIFIMAFIEKIVDTKLKYVYLFILSLHSIFQFYYIAFFEYNLFNDALSFDALSIVMISSYFVFELALTFYVINKLYTSKTTGKN